MTTTTTSTQPLLIADPLPEVLSSTSPENVSEFRRRKAVCNAAHVRFIALTKLSSVISVPLATAAFFVPPAHATGVFISAVLLFVVGTSTPWVFFTRARREAVKYRWYLEDSYTEATTGVPIEDLAARRMGREKVLEDLSPEQRVSVLREAKRRLDLEILTGRSRRRPPRE